MGEEEQLLLQEENGDVNFGTFESALGEHRPVRSKTRGIPKRWQVALLGNFGFFLAISVRLQFGAIRAMADENATTLTDLPEEKRVPWWGIFTSVAVWAITVENFARTWTMLLLAQHQLTYMQQGLHLGGLWTGILSAIPHIIMGINTVAGGHIADFLIRTNKLSIKNVRKLMNFIGFGSEGMCLLVLSFVSENAIMAILLLSLSVGISGFGISGFQVNILDIAPQHAGILMAWSSGVGATAGVICPMVTESLISTSSNGWQHVFQLAGGIHLFCVLFYIVFASGKRQHWAM